MKALKALVGSLILATLVSEPALSADEVSSGDSRARALRNAMAAACGSAATMAICELPA